MTLVLAHLLDINIHTANAWANHASYDWTSYLAARTGRRRWTRATQRGSAEPEGGHERG